VSSLEIMTTNGCVVCLRHTAPGTDHDAPTPFTTFFLGGALGGLSGGGGAFPRLAKDFGGVRIHYRLASRLDECLLDVMMVNHHLSQRYGLERVALMGHSFGGGLAPAGGVLLGPHCAGVVAVAASASAPSSSNVWKGRRCCSSTAPTTVTSPGSRPSRSSGRPRSPRRCGSSPAAITDSVPTATRSTTASCSSSSSSIADAVEDCSFNLCQHHPDQ